LFLVGEMFQPERSWRLDLGPDVWVLRRGSSRSVLGRCSPREIDRLALDRQGQVIATTVDGQRRMLTGPMAPFEAAWVQQTLAGRLGIAAQGRGAGDVEPAEVYAGVPTVDPSAPEGTRSRHRLERREHPWKSTLGCLAVTLFWNLITGVFVAAQLGVVAAGSRPGWLFLTPFILVGLVAIAGFLGMLYSSIVDSRAGSIVVEVSKNPLRPGERCQVFVAQPDRFEPSSLRVRLVCEEKVTYASGDTTSTESKRVRELEVYPGEGIDSGGRPPFETTFEFEVPPGAMHSLQVENNEILWLLEVEVGPADRPTTRRAFAIVVNPPRPSGASS
jgi:hypothetical protein